MCQVLSSGIVKTRKPHRCWGCTTLIPIGTLTARSTGIDGGEISSAYWCEVCVRLPKDLFSDDCIGWGDLREEAEAIRGVN